MMGLPQMSAPACHRPLAVQAATNRRLQISAHAAFSRREAAKYE